VSLQASTLYPTLLASKANEVADACDDGSKRCKQMAVGVVFLM
jgi:hypothetical protein